MKLYFNASPNWNKLQTVSAISIVKQFIVERTNRGHYLQRTFVPRYSATPRTMTFFGVFTVQLSCYLRPATVLRMKKFVENVKKLRLKYLLFFVNAWYQNAFVLSRFWHVQVSSQLFAQSLVLVSQRRSLGLKNLGSKIKIWRLNDL